MSSNSLTIQKTLEAGKTVIGVNIGITSVNVVQTAQYRGRPTIIKAAVEDIAIATERERENATIAAIKRALLKFNTKKADIVCVMSGRQAIVEDLVMPLMPPEDLPGAVKLEISSSQHATIADPVIDYKVVGRILDNDVEKMNVVVALAARAAIDSLLAKFSPRTGKASTSAAANFESERPVGVDVAAIIPMAIAFENIVKKWNMKLDEIVVVLEMGTMTTELNIYRNSQLAFTRQISTTSFELTKSLTGALFTDAGKLELTVPEAEAIKREHGIPVPGENYLINGKITAGQVLSLLRPKLEQLSMDINRAFDSFEAKMHFGKVDRIVVFGGGARLKGLPEFLNAELGIPVELGDPLQGVDLLSEDVFQDKGDAQKLSSAIGASLSGPSGINLVPPDVKERKKKFLEMVAMASVAGVFILALAFFYFGTAIDLAAAHQKVSVARSEYKKIEPQLRELKKGLSLKKAIRHRPDMGMLLKHLSYMPSYMYLTELNVHNGNISLSGFVLGTTKEVQNAPQDFVDDLKKGVIKDAKLSLNEPMANRTDVIQFQIDGLIVSGGK